MYQVAAPQPIPTNLPDAKGSEMKFPFRLMEVGESFFVPDGDGVKDVTLRVYMSRARRRVNTPDRNFKMERVEGGRRIWRVK